jgi:hypothetical protein
MECWTHNNINLDVHTINRHLRDSWEQENNKYDLKMDLQALKLTFRSGILTGNGNWAHGMFPLPVQTSSSNPWEKEYC